MREALNLRHPPRFSVTDPGRSHCTDGLFLRPLERRSREFRCRLPRCIDGDDDDAPQTRSALYCALVTRAPGQVLCITAIDDSDCCGAKVSSSPGLFGLGTTVLFPGGWDAVKRLPIPFPHISPYPLADNRFFLLGGQPTPRLPVSGIRRTSGPAKHSAKRTQQELPFSLSLGGRKRGCKSDSTTD